VGIRRRISGFLCGSGEAFVGNLKHRSLRGGELRELSGFSEFRIVSVPWGDAVAF